jgi:hypothetical protein
MNWAWASPLDQLWRSPALPMWVAAVAFALVLLVTLFRAEKSVANGALTVITLLAIGIAVAATVRSFGRAGAGATADTRTPLTVTSLPALSCLDGLAGDVVEAACEKPLFATAESSAAAVSYTAAQITRLASFGDEAAANKVMTPELSALRRAVERDRYGLVAYVLSVRDGCTPADCAFYKSLSDHNQIAANMTERTYLGLIGRYAQGWNGSSTAAAMPALPPSVPTGKPLSGDFPNSASIPPVSIMTAEPAAPPGASPVPASSPKPGPAVAQQASRPPAPPAAAKKQAPKKNAAAPAPVPLAPPSQSDDN